MTAGIGGGLSLIVRTPTIAARTGSPSLKTSAPLSSGASNTHRPLGGFGCLGGFLCFYANTSGLAVVPGWAVIRSVLQRDRQDDRDDQDARRSEEHTSELQSRENLVCRLLLEKKK